MRPRRQVAGSSLLQAKAVNPPDTRWASLGRVVTQSRSLCGILLMWLPADCVLAICLETGLDALLVSAGCVGAS